MNSKDTKFEIDRDKMLSLILEKSILTRTELEKISGFTRYKLERVLNNLEGANLIQIEPVFGKNRIFVTDQKEDIIIDVALKIPVYHKIIKYLLVHPEEQLDELSEQIQKARSTTFNHLEKLIHADIIKKSFVERKLFYSLKNSKRLKRLEKEIL